MQTKCGPDADVSRSSEGPEQPAAESAPKVGLLACTKCKVEYPETSEYFIKNKRKLNGLDSWCRACRKTYVKQYAVPPGINPEEKHKIRGLREIAECVICGEPEKEGKQLAIDHDHATGLFAAYCVSGAMLGWASFETIQNCCGLLRCILKSNARAASVMCPVGINFNF